MVVKSHHKPHKLAISHEHHFTAGRRERLNLMAAVAIAGRVKRRIFATWMYPYTLKKARVIMNGLINARYQVYTLRNA